MFTPLYILSGQEFYQTRRFPEETFLHMALTYKKIVFYDNCSKVPNSVHVVLDFIAIKGCSPTTFTLNAYPSYVSVAYDDKADTALCKTHGHIDEPAGHRPVIPAKPSQVAERTKRFSIITALIVVLSNRFAIQSLP
jgi:hypothetical protein